jgi:hypothetical protein
VGAAAVHLGHAAAAGLARAVLRPPCGALTATLPAPPPRRPPPPGSIIYYPSEELEELDLDEIARDGHMVLLPQGGLQ